MIGEAEAAVLTDLRTPTASTQQSRCVSPPIQQDQDLLLAIQPCGDGLLKVQEILESLFPESSQNPLETPLPLDRVPIQTGYGCFGKDAFQNLLNLLGTMIPSAYFATIVGILGLSPNDVEPAATSIFTFSVTAPRRFRKFWKASFPKQT